MSPPLGFAVFDFLRQLLGNLVNLQAETIQKHVQHSWEGPIQAEEAGIPTSSSGSAGGEDEDGEASELIN